MSLCTPCTRLNNISLCTDSVIIGEAPASNTPYVVYFKSLATGAVYSYHITSDASKMLELIFVDGFPLASETDYEMWINVSGNSIETQLNLIIGTTTAKCFRLSGSNVYDAYYSENENFTTQTLTVST